MPKKHWSAHVDRSSGHRSGLEGNIAAQLAGLGITDVYETKSIEYHSTHHYIPDFVLPNGIIIEGKGWFTAEDRTKHLLVQAQHPELDIRFVFSNANKKLTTALRGATYGDWCTKNGFQYANKLIPPSWVKEKGPKRNA